MNFRHRKWDTHNSVQDLGWSSFTLEGGSGSLIFKVGLALCFLLYFEFIHSTCLQIMEKPRTTKRRKYSKDEDREDGNPGIAIYFADSVTVHAVLGLPSIATIPRSLPSCAAGLPLLVQGKANTL